MHLNLFIRQKQSQTIQEFSFRTLLKFEYLPQVEVISYHLNPHFLCIEDITVSGVRLLPNVFLGQRARRLPAYVAVSFRFVRDCDSHGLSVLYLTSFFQKLLVHLLVSVCLFGIRMEFLRARPATSGSNWWVQAIF